MWPVVLSELIYRLKKKKEKPTSLMSEELKCCCLCGAHQAFLLFLLWVLRPFEKKLLSGVFQGLCTKRSTTLSISSDYLHPY